jgi:DNA polymerase I-like protein with 3'-5' exonuclease and polymerase domains
VLLQSCGAIVCKHFLVNINEAVQEKKLGAVIGEGIEKGKQLRERFESSFPMVKSLKEKIIMSIRANQGMIKAIDGRYLVSRSEHSALNVLLQSCGAIVCKHFLVNINEAVQEKKLDAKPVANVHDEVQWEVRRDQAEEFGAITKQAMKKAERDLKFKCPLDSEFQIGDSWKETH